MSLSARSKISVGRVQKSLSARSGNLICKILFDGGGEISRSTESGYGVVLDWEKKSCGKGRNLGSKIIILWGH